MDLAGKSYKVVPVDEGYSFVDSKSNRWTRLGNPDPPFIFETVTSSYWERELTFKILIWKYYVLMKKV